MPWRLQSAEVRDDFKLFVRFLDGTDGIVEMRMLIHSATAGVFSALRDVNVFRQACVEHGAVTWPGELDLAPDAMYRAIKDHGRWVV